MKKTLAALTVAASLFAGDHLSHAGGLHETFGHVIAAAHDAPMAQEVMDLRLKIEGLIGGEEAFKKQQEDGVLFQNFPLLKLEAKDIKKIAQLKKNGGHGDEGHDRLFGVLAIHDFFDGVLAAQDKPEGHELSNDKPEDQDAIAAQILMRRAIPKKWDD